MAGFADGVVKVFDGRLEDDDAIVRTYSDHTSWVQNVRWHPTLSGQLLSAGYASAIVDINHFDANTFLTFRIDGEVKLFDLRSSDYATRTWNIHPDGLSAFDVHPISNVFAAYVTTYYCIIYLHLSNSSLLGIHLSLRYIGKPNGLSCTPLTNPRLFLPSVSLQVLYLPLFVAFLRLSSQDPVHLFSTPHKCYMLLVVRMVVVSLTHLQESFEVPNMLL